MLHHARAYAARVLHQVRSRRRRHAVEEVALLARVSLGEDLVDAQSPISDRDAPIVVLTLRRHTPVRIRDAVRDVTARCAASENPLVREADLVVVGEDAAASLSTLARIGPTVEPGDRRRSK